MPPTLSFQKPCPALQEVVRFHGYKCLLQLNHVVSHRATAKAETVVEFIFGDQPLVRHEHHGTTRCPVSLLIGPQTSPGIRLEFSSLDSFGIVFQPDGLHKLFGLPVHEITDDYGDAGSVFGSLVNRMAEQLGNCRTFEERIQVANRLLLRIYQNSDRRKGISPVVSRILQSGGNERIDVMFRETGLSKRTFERRFQEQVGMSAKLFSRITRFQSALDRKARSQRTSWTAISQECGYFDQMHLIHDFEEFTGACPEAVLRSVQRLYGDTIHCGWRSNDSEKPDSLLL
jgi:AraC-like DNA-binding protein